MSGASEQSWPSEDIRPVVATASGSNRGLWAFLAVLAIGGFALFSALNANRLARQAPSTIVPQAAPGSRISSPPPLALAQAYPEARDYDRLPPIVPDEPAPVRAVRPPEPPRTVQPPAVQYTPDPMPPRPLEPQSSVVFEAPARGLPAPAALEPNSSGDRVQAGRFANPSRTIPQGTVIPAVLETALDSNHAGAVRALVQRDVYGFDGTRVLIQRGSRLYGTYKADLEAGQNRALVQWTRLIRPDGVTVALDSPSSDPLGRAGIKGKVDSKFFQRFGGAVLQSVLDLGVAVASRKATDGVIVALPGSTQNVQVQQSDQVKRTLKVKHGTSVSVFVARDLDFSSVEY